MSFFTALFDVGTLIGGPILGAVIDAAGWGPMYFTAGAAMGVATVLFAWWDHQVAEPNPTTASGVETSRIPPISTPEVGENVFEEDLGS